MDISHWIVMALGFLGGVIAVLLAWMLSPDGMDAERYRWLKATTNFVTSGDERIDIRGRADEWDAIIDKQRAAAGKEQA